MISLKPLRNLPFSAKYLRLTLWLAESDYFQLLLGNLWTEMAPFLVSCKCSGCLYTSVLVWLRNVSLKRESQMPSPAVVVQVTEGPRPAQTGFLFNRTKPGALQRKSHCSLAPTDPMCNARLQKMPWNVPKLDLVSSAPVVSLRAVPSRLPY